MGMATYPKHFMDMVGAVTFLILLLLIEGMEDTVLTPTIKAMVDTETEDITLILLNTHQCLITIVLMVITRTV